MYIFTSSLIIIDYLYIIPHFTDPPYVTTETTSLINLEEEKDSVSMKCRSESNPPSKVWWEKEGVNGVFSPDREITISPVTRSTAGTYKCVAQNALGMSEPGFVEVDVKCKFKPNFHVRTSPNFFDNQL